MFQAKRYAFSTNGKAPIVVLTDFEEFRVFNALKKPDINLPLEGVLKDYDEAEKWLRKSIESGDADAKTYLGYLLEFGIGLDKDLVESRQLYREAASAGHPWAKTRLSK